MLEHSFTLVKRHQKDQHRLEAENELKLQNQLNQFWQKIDGLERHAQQSDIGMAALRQRLLAVEQEKALTDARLQQLEAENTSLMKLLGRLGEDEWASESSSTSPETATPSAAATPNVITRRHDTTHFDNLSAELDPVILHPMLPKLLFVLNPVVNVLSDGSEFPLSMLSSFRSILAEMLDDEDVDTGQIARLNNVAGNAFTTKEKCLYRYLQKSILSGGAKTVWTKEHRCLYACRTCVNKQRLCITIVKGQLLVLPLHPLFRTFRGDDRLSDEPLRPLLGNIRGDYRLSDEQMSSTGKATPDAIPTELQYWVVARAWLARSAPYNADIWSKPVGQH